MNLRRGERVGSRNLTKLAFDGLVSHLRTKLDHLVPAFERPRSCEPWLHLEIGHVLLRMRERGQIMNMELEKPYPHPRGARCDIWFNHDHSEVWIEVKPIITSYGGAKRTISDQVDAVVKDAEKLGNAPAEVERYVLFVVYPLASAGTNDDAWKQHMDRLENALSIVSGPANMKVTQDESIRLYLGSPR